MNDKCCHVIGAGDFSPRLLKIEDGDIVIACDGGYGYLKEHNIACDFCIGDFDSLGIVPKGDFQVKVLPTVKDVTDSHAACIQAMEMGYRKIKLYGMLGGKRFSHTVANLQLLCGFCDLDCDVTIIDENCTITPIKNGSIEFDDKKQGFVSVFAMDGEIKYSCKGLKYTVEDHLLTPTFALGVSNEFISLPSKITIEGGIAIIITENK